jgi:hypothetical protein
MSHTRIEELGNTSVTSVTGGTSILSELLARFSMTPAPLTPLADDAPPKPAEPPPATSADATELPRLPFGMPADAVIVVMDKDAYTDQSMKGEPYMWTWIGATTWFYVKDYPVPVRFAT